MNDSDLQQQFAQTAKDFFKIFHLALFISNQLRYRAWNWQDSFRSYAQKINNHNHNHNNSNNYANNMTNNICLKCNRIQVANSR